MVQIPRRDIDNQIDSSHLVLFKDKFIRGKNIEFTASNVDNFIIQFNQHAARFTCLASQWQDRLRKDILKVDSNAAFELAEQTYFPGINDTYLDHRKVNTKLSVLMLTGVTMKMSVDGLLKDYQSKGCLTYRCDSQHGENGTVYHYVITPSLISPPVSLSDMFQRGTSRLFRMLSSSGNDSSIVSASETKGAPSMTPNGKDK